MSDIQNETTTVTNPSLGGAPPAETATDDDASLEARVSALEARVTTLETTGTASSTTTLAASPGVASAEPDWNARTDELIAQGMSEQDAVEQSAYEQRTWHDHNNPVAQVTV